MAIHYYLSVFPMEALIASQLDPHQFACYMAIGSKKGSQEQIIFVEIEGGFADGFDWKYAEERCVPHATGDPKHSVYLGVYRVLERIPLSVFGSMYLTTRDGRSIALERQSHEAPARGDNDFYVYQELCPVNAVIVSRLAPREFGPYLSDPGNKIHMPTVIYADLKVINLEDPVRTGNIGTLYDGKIPHLMECISDVTGPEMKTNKTLTRTHVESFAFQSIQHGLYISSTEDALMYHMPSVEEIKEIDYDWGKSAYII